MYGAAVGPADCFPHVALRKRWTVSRCGKGQAVSHSASADVGSRSPGLEPSRLRGRRLCGRVSGRLREAGIRSEGCVWLQDRVEQRGVQYKSAQGAVSLRLGLVGECGFGGARERLVLGLSLHGTLASTLS